MSHLIFIVDFQLEVAGRMTILTMAAAFLWIINNKEAIVTEPHRMNQWTISYFEKYNLISWYLSKLVRQILNI